MSPYSLELLEFVERLPEQERVVIGLRHFDGHSIQDISQITGRPIGTVSKQLSRAHERLRGWVNEENSNEQTKANHGPARSSGTGTSKSPVDR
ncbi:MAG: sigma-70 family RNA polymerase sigma factor [Pirellulaceae bacterium]